LETEACLIAQREVHVDLGLHFDRFAIELGGFVNPLANSLGS
jgi:hypothetical protein